VGAWAAQDAGRSDAIPGLHLASVHDCRSATGRDFQMAMAVTERRALRARRSVPQQHREQQLQGASPKVAYRLVA
jgi:hypothetical protein